MLIRAKFLALAKESFINKDKGGEIVEYYRLHLFDTVENDYMKLPIRKEAAEACIAENVKLGDEVELNASYEPEREKDPIRIVQW